MAGAPHLKAFLDAADYFIGIHETGSNTFAPGSLGEEMCQLAGFGQGGSWCAIFVSACAEKAGIAGKIIDKCEGVGMVIESVLPYGGDWIEGPYFTGGAVTPIPGDLISIVGSPAYKYSGYGHGGHVGIVEYVKDGYVHTIEGNISDESARNVRAIDDDTINGYSRPNWEALGDNITEYLAAAGLGYSTGPLYANMNDRHDMTLREVGYLDANYKPVNKQTGIGFSIINYTTTLGQLYEMFAPAPGSTVVVDTSSLTGNTRIAMDFFIQLGFNAAAAAGLTAAITVYSDLNPMFAKDVGTLGHAHYIFGICGWDGEKHKLMKQRVGADWNKDLSGQLQFLLDDLSTDSYQGLLDVLKRSSLTAIDAKLCASAFFANYNKYYTSIKDKENVKKIAEELFNKVVITTVSIGNNLTNLLDENGNVLQARKSVDVPDYVNQSGILGQEDYTSYSAWYSGSPAWASGTTQRILADMWAYQGCPCNRGVATLDGYYLVAVRPVFGTVGDVIVVTLEDGTQFSAIIADEKGEDAGNEWGHSKPMGISLIEWQAIVTYNGKVQIEGASYTLIDGVEVDDWYRKKVVNITNYGSFLC